MAGYFNSAMFHRTPQSTQDCEMFFKTISNTTKYLSQLTLNTVKFISMETLNFWYPPRALSSAPSTVLRTVASAPSTVLRAVASTQTPLPPVNQLTYSFELLLHGVAGLSRVGWRDIKQVDIPKLFNIIADNPRPYILATSSVIGGIISYRLIRKAPYTALAIATIATMALVPTILSKEI